MGVVKRKRGTLPSVYIFDHYLVCLHFYFAIYIISLICLCDLRMVCSTRAYKWALGSSDCSVVMGLTGNKTTTHEDAFLIRPQPRQSARFSTFSALPAPRDILLHRVNNKQWFYYTYQNTYKYKHRYVMTIRFSCLFIYHCKCIGVTLLRLMENKREERRWKNEK